MTVPSQPTVFQHTANGITTVFAFDCLVLLADDLKVYLDGAPQASGYAVAGLGVDSGGTVTFSAAPASGVIVTLSREVELERETDYQNNGDLRAPTLNNDFDRIWMALQQNGGRLDRAVRIGVDDPTAPAGLVLPLPAARGNKFLVFDADGNVSISQGTGADAGLRDDLTAGSVPGVGLVVDSIAALRGASRHGSGRVFVVGYYAKGDGGGGPYYYDPNDLSSTDNGGTIIVANDGGRWKLQIQSGAISVLQFGADPTGTEDLAPILETICGLYELSQVPPRVIIPNGMFAIKSTATISASLVFEGAGTVDTGTRIFADPALNAAMFLVTGQPTFRGMTITGLYDYPLQTSSTCVTISGASQVTFDDIVFLDSIAGIYVPGSAPSFYMTLQNCKFINTRLAHLGIDNSSAAGVDLMMTHVRFLGSMPSRCWSFANGLGSIIASDVQISVTGTEPANSLCYFGLPAPSYGGAQFTNVVFEGAGSSAAAVDLAGSALYPWKEMHFTNCLLTGGPGHALRVGSANGVTFDNCTLSSSNATAQVIFSAFQSALGLRFVACRHESGSSAPVFYAPANAVVALSAVTPTWEGSSPFVNFGAVAATQVDVDVIGGSVGTHATPIILADYRNTKKNIQAHGVDYGPTQRVILVGDLDGSGAATIAHGIIGGAAKIHSAGAWYRGGSGEMRSLAISSIDGTNVSVTAGGAGASYRVCLFYTHAADASW